MHGLGKSDSPIVPKTHSNKGCEEQPAEGVEGRGLAKGNPDRQTRDRTQCREDLQQALKWIRQAATKDRKQRFTALWHHVYDVNRLREEFLQNDPVAPRPAEMNAYVYVANNPLNKMDPYGLCDDDPCKAYKDCGDWGLYGVCSGSTLSDSQWSSCVRKCLLSRYHNCKYDNGFATDHYYCWAIQCGEQ